MKITHTTKLVLSKDDIKKAIEIYIAENIDDIPAEDRAAAASSPIEICFDIADTYDLQAAVIIIKYPERDTKKAAEARAKKL